jgi:hypothetical protein
VSQQKLELRRALVLKRLPERRELTFELTAIAAGVTEDLVAYVLDPRGGAILATDEARAQALDRSLFDWVGPGNAAPIDDQIAALVAGPILGKGRELSPLLLRHRFSPRADDAVALAIASLEKSAQPGALEALFADAGPDADVLALSTVQCGRVLAWNPPLLAAPIAETIVDALLELLAPTRPRPLLDLAARALGPIAAAGAMPGASAQASTLRERIIRRARAGLDGPARPASFAAEVAGIERNRWLDQPLREVAAASAYILGAAAPLDREAFVGYRAHVLEHADAADLMQPFVDGLVALPHVPALCELAMELVEAGQGEAALMLASQLPLDDLGEFLVAALDAPAAAHRALAAAAVELIQYPDADAALAARLSDPSPEVTAAAARALIGRGRRDLVARHSAREVQAARRAVVLASLGELSVPVIGELVRGALAQLDASGEEVAPSPVTRLVGEALLTSVAGLEVAADLIGGVPEAAGLLALAGMTERDVAVTAPPHVRALFADACYRVTSDEELEALALHLLARVSSGDAELAQLIAAKLGATSGYAGTYLGALGELRVATPETAAAIAPHVAPQSPIGARVVAAAICGRALPPDHPAWADVRELLTLGTIARAAAWSALRDRARRN